jgi:hypothetical protein
MAKKPIANEILHTRDRRQLCRADRVRELDGHAVIAAPAHLRDVLDRREPPFADDRDAIADALDLAEVVRGQEHGSAARLVLADDRQELLLHERVEARGRLVEDEQLRPVEERLDEPDLLPVAARQLAGGPVEVRSKPLGELGSAAEIAHAAHGGAVAQQLVAAEPRVDREVAGQVAQARADREAVAVAVEPEDPRRAARRALKVQESADHRRLSRPIRPEKAEHLTRRDVQGDLIDPPQGAVALRQRPGLDQV